MIYDQRVVIVMPGYNVERTLERTCRAVDRRVVDEVILVDDCSHDRTVAIAKRLGLTCIRHELNKGYGAAQKTGYQAALNCGADVVVMLHPDDQYPAEQTSELATLIASGQYDLVLGSRMLDGGAIRRGMPRYKYVSNRVWTWWQNQLLGIRLSEYHTGLRAFSRAILLQLPLLENSDDFLFDNQVLVQAIYFNWRIGEMPTAARFPDDCSSMSPWRGVWYGLGIVGVTMCYLAQRAGVLHRDIFDPNGQRFHVRLYAECASGHAVDCAGNH